MNRKNIIILITISVAIIVIIAVGLQKPDESSINEFTFCKPTKDNQKTSRILEGFIPWTKDYCLQIKDFQGEVNLNNEHYAQTQWSLKAFPQADVKVNKNGTTEIIFVDIEVVAFFDTKKSWFKSETLSKMDQQTLLRHEQGHIDLAEEHARFLEEELEKTLVRESFLIENDVVKTVQNSKDKMLEIFDKYYYEIYNMDFLQNEYDRITNHGKNAKEQIEFNMRFDKLRE